MSETQAPWDRQLNEPPIWYKRFTKFRLMEPVRSIADVYREEQKGEKESVKPPGRWYETAKRWQWEERAVAWDAHVDEQLEKRIAAERKSVLRSRYALLHKRVEALDTIAQRLIGYLDDENNVWLPDVKAIGTGPNARQVDLVRFNDALFSEIRGYLGDIAAEKGERVKKNELSIKELPKEYFGFNPNQDGSDA